MKKILLLGASGQLGREWQTYLSTFERSDLKLVPYTSDQLDITRPNDLQHEICNQQPDLIINCAAYTKVDDAEEAREQAQNVNARAVKTIAEICAENNVRLVHFSTDYIFAGKQEDQQEFPEGYPEGHKANPINWYGQTKWEGENAIRSSGCKHLIMRVSWLCGAFGSNFVKTMLRLAGEHAEIDVVSDQFGSPTFTYGLVRNTFKLIETERQGTYHYCTKGVISWADFAKAIFDLADKDVEVNCVSSAEFPTKAARPSFSKLSTRKIEQVNGVVVERWKEGLQQLLEQIKKRNNN